MKDEKGYEDIIQKLKDASAELQKVIGQLEIRIADSEQPDLIESAPDNTTEPEKKYTFTEVRTIIAGKAREGFTSTVKMLLAKHGFALAASAKNADFAGLIIADHAAHGVF